MAKEFDVDFQHVRGNADMVAVLAHYGIALTGAGDQKIGLCPFHTDTRPSLNVNIKKRVFNCFVCGEGGNVIDFVERVDPEVQNVRRAALLVASLSNIAATLEGPRRNVVTIEHKPKRTIKLPAQVSPHEPEEASDVEHDTDGVILDNRPLTFTLKLEPLTDHPLLATLETAPEALLARGIGVARRGSMKDRLVFPIHNRAGALVAYCGRYLGDVVPVGETKYRFPAGFKKSLELYGLEHVRPESGIVVLVESFLSVVKLGAYAAADQRVDVLGLMGTSISDEQVALLRALGKGVVVMFDGDAAGLVGSREVAGAIAFSGLWARVHNMPAGMKPHHVDAAGFWQHLGGSGS